MFLEAAVGSQAEASTEATSASETGGYRLGANDEVVVQVLDAEEIPDKPLRIDGRGNLSLPLLGRVVAAGLTVEQLETELAARLAHFLHEPQVTVSLAEVRSRPVSVLGAVNRPGVHQIDSPKTIVEMLSLAGGLREDAGHTIKITRRADSGTIPLGAARADPSGRFSVAEINVKDVLEARRPEDNIVILAHDVISVPRAEMVYVIGEVEKSGGFVLEDRESVSVLQALSLAGGLTAVAGVEQARILRGDGRSYGSGDGSGDGRGDGRGDGSGEGRGQNGAQSSGHSGAQGGAQGGGQGAGNGRGERVEIAVNLKAIMAGESPDVALQSEDILFVPRSGKRAAGQAMKRLAIGTLSGIAIWRVGSR